MTQWLRDENIPEDMLLGDECELRESSEDGSILRCKRQDLSAEEVTMHLNAGKQAYKVAIEWGEKFSAILNDDLTIKRLKFDDTLLAEADDEGADDAAAKFDADFAIMTLTLAAFLPRLLEYFEGEKIPV
jgi:recombination associated protein RdgC